MIINKDEHKEFLDFLDSYNECFYEKDIEKLRSFYDSNLIYYDNHTNNDTFDLEQHLILLSDFFEHGKDTESGGVEPILIENMQIFRTEGSACLCFITRYQSFPDPAIRSTFYLEHVESRWYILHVHCSFQPS